MKDPERLLESGSDFERSLLRSARTEAPSRKLEGRVLAALAVPVPPAGIEPSSPSLFTLTAPRGLAMAIAVVGLGALVAASIGRRAEAPAKVPTAAPVVMVSATHVAPLEPVPSAVITPDSLPNAPAVVPAARASVSAAARDVAQGGASIEREIELLDAVKAKLGTGNAADAARALDSYDQEFPRGTLRPEGTVLRIRTLLLQGDRAAANALADTFVAQHPSSVHAKRVRALLGD